MVDIGCYHGIPAGRRDAYAAEVAAVTKPGADLYLAGVSDPPAAWRLLGARGINADDLRRRFGAYFDLVDERKAGAIGRAGPFVLYHLLRRDVLTGDADRSLAAAGLTLLLPRRAAGRRTAVPRERAAEYAREAVH